MKKVVLLLLLICTLAFIGCDKGGKTPQEILDGIKIELTVSADFNLPKEVSWTVKSGTAITIDGNKAKVVRPAYGTDDATVVLTATAKVDEESLEKDFTFIVKAMEQTATDVLNALVVPTKVYQDFELSNTVTWKVKSGTAIQIVEGTAKVTVPSNGEGDATVVLTATATVNGKTSSKDFTVIVLEKELTALDVLNALNVSESVTENFELSATVEWTVKTGTAITINGNQAVVTRPAVGLDASIVVLTATATVGTDVATKDFTIAVESLGKKEDIRINGVELPSGYALYLSNKKEKTNKKTEFFDLTQKYLVGTANAWVALPEVSFVLILDYTTGDIKTVIPAQWKYFINILVLDGDEFVQAPDNLIESIDEATCKIDFSELAIGKTFHVEIYPDGLTDKQKENIADYTTSFEIDVVNGYNVYSAKELGYIENRAEGEEATAWKAFKAENGLDLAATYPAVILHKDIDVTANDVPEYFFYAEDELSKADSDYERALGSMKDNNDFYFHQNVENEEFGIFGNYFKLDVSSFKEVVRESNKITPEGTVISHATLFQFEGPDSSKAIMKDLYIIGNAPRTNDVIKSGGQIIVKNEGPQYEAYNNITICSFITYMSERSTALFEVEKCKVYDAFNCFIYNWGSSNVVLKNSEMIGAGGPVIIQDHVDSTSADGGKVPSTKVENCNLQSYVTGQEGWFSIVGATAMVPQIMGLDLIFNQFGRSFLKSSSDGSHKYMNFICVNKSGSAEGLTSEKVSGSCQIDQATFNYGTDNPYLSTVLDQTFALGAPTFQTSAATATAGWAYFDGTTLVNPVAPVDQSPEIAQGDYLTVYIQGMMIILGYGQMGEAYDPA